MKKRFLSILLSLCMVLAFFPAVAFAEETEGVDITINGPDVICAQQDYEFTVTAPEGVTCKEFGFDFGDKGSGADLNLKDGVLSGTVLAEWYDLNKDSFKLMVHGTTEDEKLISASKTVKIQRNHIFVDGVCGCGEKQQYTVQYDGGGEGGLMVAFKTHGEDLKLLGETFYHDDFVQTGWLDKDSGRIYELGDTYNIDADVTLIPKWSCDVSTEAELRKALDANITFIRLISDFKLSSKLNLSDKTITIDLNGHTLTGNIILADTSAAPKSILTLIDSDPVSGGVLNGAIELTRENYGNASHLYANGGTITGKLSLNSYIAKIFCTSDTPTAIKGYAGNYGEIHGGIFYGVVQESCIKEKTVTFMNNSSRYAIEVVAADSYVVAPIEPTVPEGMRFAGWYTDKALTDKYEFGGTLPESITLYAGFVPITYTVQYDGGAEFPLMVAFKTHGEDLELAGETFYRDGYVQTGWLDKDSGRIYELGGIYSTDADVTLFPYWDEKIVTFSVPFTTTVKLGDNGIPGETTFDLAIVGANADEESYADVTIFATVTTNGAGSYAGTMTLTGPFEQLRNMLCEGAFVQQVDAGEANWTYDNTVWGLLLTEGVALASMDDAAPEYTVLILPTTCEETENGIYYDLDWDANPLEQMSFTNIYTKTVESNTDGDVIHQTGDNSNLTLWFAMLAVSVAGMMSTGAYSKRKRSSQAK